MPTEQSTEQDRADMPSTADGALSAGSRLRKERVQLGLSEKDVADRLHITMHYVRSIETDKYEKLPGAVFAKGYIKRYAELLELDVEELLAAYESFQAGRQAEHDEAIRQQVRHRKDKNKHWVVLSVLVFCGGFAALWAYNNSDGENVDPAIASSSLEPVNRIVEPAVTAVTPEELEPARANPEVEPAIVPEDDGPALVDLGSRDSTTIATTVSDNVRDLSVPVEVPQFSNQQPVTPDNISIQLEADGRRIIEISADGEDVLRISFSGESWVEVNDGDANQIYRDIREAGDVLEITGNAPFSILLGDALFTQLNFNGNEIDVSEEIRIDNSARLTVGL